MTACVAAPLIARVHTCYCPFGVRHRPEQQRTWIGMKGRVLRLGLSSVAVAVAAVCGFLVLPEGHGPTPAHAETNAVTFPPLDQLEHYTTVRRGVTREHMQKWSKTSAYLTSHGML
jgi:hypothetical protein